MTTNASQVQAIVRAGFAAQGRSDLEAAEAAYLRALDVVPEHPDALQLLGLLVRRRGDHAQAEALLRRSLHAQPSQPHVWNNLGNLLAHVGRAEDALESYAQALALQPRYADAHYNRARILHSAGRVGEAASALDQALALAPSPTVGMLQLKSQIEGAGGHLEAALATIQAALQQAPERAELLHERAVLLQRLHRHADALQDHQRALALGLGAGGAHYNRGNTLQSLGRHEDAVAAYREALSVEPCHPLALFDVSRLRWRLGDADFDAELRRATDTDTSSAVAPGLLGRLYLRAGRKAEAIAAFREAIRRDPNSAPCHEGLGHCLVRMGDTLAGLAAHRRAVELAPTDACLLTSHAASLLMVRRAADGAAAAEAALALAPHDQYAWALVGLAWQLLGDPRAAWLGDCARLVSVSDLQPPPGFGSAQAFHAALAGELRQLHRDRAPPVDQTLRHGTQSFGDIFEQGHPQVDALKGRITQAVSRYVAALPEDAEHPFLKRKSISWRFTDSWSSRLHGSGFHTNHVHPHGWISATYYVCVPPTDGNDPGHPGWLHFGEPDLELGLPCAKAMRVEPKPGRLVLFPSMFWHGTEPLTGDGERLTIAFDMLPR